MYLAIDIGGSKTLFSVFNNQGQAVRSHKVPTNKNYSEFLKELKEVISSELNEYSFIACCCAAPGEIDRETGTVLRFGNLPWKNVQIKKELERIFTHTKVFVENDAKLAGLSEAQLHKNVKKVLYLTISTGIGDGIIIDDKIDPDFADSEPGQMMLEFEGTMYKWEDLASGRALFAKYGQKASEITDPKIWQHFSKALARGINQLIATLQPELIILGGGVGAHYEKFSKYLEIELKKLENEMVQTPQIVKARHAEEAVVYGCYTYIKQNL